jgi:lipopolysaccharide biosynthesis protein
MFAFLIHIYYPDSWEKIIREKLLPLRVYEPQVLVNICNVGNQAHNLINLIKQDFPAAVFIVSPNKGKDIGGKLALIDLFIKLGLQTDYMVFLHDKISPHAVKGEKWRNSLFNITGADAVPKILEEFTHHKKTGIVGSAEFIMNEYDAANGRFTTNNNEKIKELLEKYHISVKDFSFIGGTMFWIRSAIVSSFFSIVPALGCRENLEEGNVMDDANGTYTHAWERLICWIATSQHYSIKGI